MKILDANASMITNFELSRFIQTQQQQNASQAPKRRTPVNMDTLVKEVQSYLRTFPNPLHEPGNKAPVRYSPYDTYSDEAILELVQRLAPMRVSKSETMAILNLRPENMAILLAVLEDADERWSAEELKKILHVITSILGRFSDELRAHYPGGKGEELAAQESEEAES
ncbi:hypothetical protein MKZ38_007782 [Zalerion maritima]|uniref:DNA-directed RNA polymerase III subunit RPC9 n=1 Tax=Zalerion maritima TaxID=339359 RepID=A0AAD5WN41_9PEZI|nr:hypothetical protein MKZ38_007782 [Zalerion maritima]